MTTNSDVYKSISPRIIFGPFQTEEEDEVEEGATKKNNNNNQ